MKTITLLSWNVNGLRAVHKKGLLDWFTRESPDVLAVQETKCQIEQVPEELRAVPGYQAHFAAARRPGYSGVGLWTKPQPAQIHPGFGPQQFDSEGRTIIAEYDSFTLFNVYFPNGGMSDQRLQYKYDFYDAFLAYLKKYRKKQPNIIICGDVNTAHTEIDLARPKENEDNTGFLPDERAWIDRLLAAGFVDTFRIFESTGGHYTWWDYKTRARSRNVGWRIDYFYVSEPLKPKVKSAFIMPEVTGSDHCPIGLTIQPG